MHRVQAHRVQGAGLGFRPQFAADLLTHPSTVDFVEVVAEACFVSRDLQREARALSELWPVVPHGVKLSLGSADGIDLERVSALARLACELRAEVITEHAAFVRAGGHEVGHLTALPRTREALLVLTRNVQRARRRLPDVPLLLENVAWTVRWEQQEMGEPDFYAELVRQSGCDLLLDLGNLYANALNAGLDPRAELARFPLESVRMIHLAGGRWQDGFYFDDHAHVVSRELFQLLELALDRTGPVPTLIERDAAFPEFSELREQLAEVRALQRRGPAIEPRPQAAIAREALAAQPGALAASREALAAQQAELARLLTARESAPGSRWLSADLQRTRLILQHKRQEEALPLLGHLAPHGTGLQAVAERVIARESRPTAFAAVADALQIADAVCASDVDERVARAAELDGLLLRARFASSRGRGLRRRVLPFVARARHPAGHVVWILKGFGRAAKTRVLHGSNRR